MKKTRTFDKGNIHRKRDEIIRYFGMQGEGPQHEGLSLAAVRALRAAQRANYSSPPLPSESHSWISSPSARRGVLFSRYRLSCEKRFLISCTCNCC